METNKITVEVVFNTGNYSSLRLGGEFTPAPKQDTEDAYREAYRQICDAFANLKAKEQAAEQPTAEQPKEQAAEQAAEPTKEFVDVHSAKFQAILKRIDEGVTLETVHKFYSFDEKGEKMLNLQHKISSRLNKNKQS